MSRVQREAFGWVAVGWAASVALGLVILLPFGVITAIVGIAVVSAYSGISGALVLRALRDCDIRRFGPANIVTSLRSALVGLVTGLVAASLISAWSGAAANAGADSATAAASPIPGLLLLGIVAPALALDAVDGWVARRTQASSQFGARFDMEVDAFALMVLSVHVAQTLGAWVLAIGLLRYVFVAAAQRWRWLARELSPRYWRKVVTAYAGIALAAALSGLLPGLAAQIAVAVALALLVESFGRDVLWLAKRRRSSADPADINAADDNPADDNAANDNAADDSATSAADTKSAGSQPPLRAQFSPPGA